MLYVKIWVVAVTVLAALTPMARAQQPNAPAAPPAGHAAHGAPSTSPGGHMAGRPTPAPADVASPDAILAAYYASLSGPAGKKRDWNRYLSLFFPGASLLPAEGKGHSGTMPHTFTPQSYLFATEPNMVEEGFIQQEIARRTERFGKIQQVFSTYEIRHAASDPTPFRRGANSFQLFFDGKRWWLFSVLWQPETTKLTLPNEYLHP